MLWAGCSWPCPEHRANQGKGAESCGTAEKESRAGDPSVGRDGAAELLLFSDAGEGRRVHPAKSPSSVDSKVFQ